MSRQLITLVGVKIGSFLNGENFLQLRRFKCATKSTRSYVLWAGAPNSLWWLATTALLSTSSAWRCRRCWVCVITGAVDNSKTSSRHYSRSFQAPLNLSLLRDSSGPRPTTNAVWITSVCCQVRQGFVFSCLFLFYAVLELYKCIQQHYISLLLQYSAISNFYNRFW